MLSEHGVTRVWHQLLWCWHHWAFFIGCDATRGVVCQEGHNVQVCCLDTRTKNRHAAWDDVGRHTLGNTKAMLVKLVSNPWSCHLHTERFNTCSRGWDSVSRCDASKALWVLRSAPLGLIDVAQTAPSEQYCGSSLELAGEWPLQSCALRASGRSSKIDFQLS